MTMNDAVMREAIAWHIRLRDMAADEWDAFAAWLEADPAHGEAYDAVSMADAAAAAELMPDAQAARAANDDDAMAVPARGPGAGWRRRMAISGGVGTAVAAALTLALLLPGKQPAGAPFDIVAGTAPRRDVALEPGTRVDLTPATRLVIDRADPRHARLDHGTAVFTVRHDPAHPFELAMGRYRVRDVGTVFEASMLGGAIDISVAEGAVLFDPDGSAIRLTPGRRLHLDAGASAAMLSKVEPASVGTWRSGSLDFADAPLGNVVAAVARATGTQIRIDPALQQHRFTGMVRLTGNAAHDVSRFAELTGTVSRRDGDQWSIEPQAAHR